MNLKIKSWTPAYLSNEQGIVLLMALAICFLITMMGGAAMMTAGTDLKITSNHKTTVEAFYIAEAGIELARQRLQDASGLNEFLINGNQGTFPFGEDKTSNNHLNGGNYIVKIYDDNDDGNPNADTNRRVYIESTGYYSSSKKQIVALVEVTAGLVTAIAAAEAYGTTKTEHDIDPGGSIDGRDWDPPSDGNIKDCVQEGISTIANCGTLTSNPATYGAFANQTDIASEADVTKISTDPDATMVGTGCLDPAASCATNIAPGPGGASKRRDTSVSSAEWGNFINSMIPKAHRNLNSVDSAAAFSTATNGSHGCVSGTCTWGTMDAPQITVLNAPTSMDLEKIVNGVGVLIIDAPTGVGMSGSGWLFWQGLVIIRSAGSVEFEIGDQAGTTFGEGGSRIFGQIVNIAGVAEIEFENSMGFVKYSSKAMREYVKKFSPGGARIISWREVM